MNPNDFIKEINSKNRKAFYLIIGGDRGAENKCYQALENIIDPSFVDFNFKKIDLSISTWADVINEALSMPFFTEPRVIICKTQNPINAQDGELIFKYLESPNTSSCLILFINKPDRRQKLFKCIQKLNMEVDCNPLRGLDLENWVKEEFKINDINIENSALKTLINKVGAETNFLNNEIEKLSIYLGPQSTLNKETIESMVAFSPNANIFELGEALAEKDINKALKTLNELLSTEHHLPILAMIIRHFRILVQIKTKLDLLKTSFLSQDVIKEMGLHPYVVKKSLATAEKWSWQKLGKALKIIENANRDLMRSTVEAKIIMEKLSLNLTAL